MRVRAIATIAAGFGLLAACSPAARHTSVAPITLSVTQTVTRTSAPATAPVGAGPTSSRPTPCPWLTTAVAQSTIGVRLGSVTTGYASGAVVGCTFYPSTDARYVTQEKLPPATQPVLRITTTRYPSAVAAHDAMVGIAEAGRDYYANPISPAIEGISYRAPFYPADGDADWAYAFRVGDTVVVINGIQTKSAFNTRAVGVAIEPAFG